MSYEIPALLLGLIIGGIFVYLAVRSRSADLTFSKAQAMATSMFENQKSQLEVSIHQIYQAKYSEWKETTLVEVVDASRADAVDTSRAVLKGKIAEQLAPFLPGFLAKYSPADARFIGSPIDYLIFKNMSKGKESEEAIEIVLLDIKTGRAGLTPIQKKIEAAATDKRISFDVLMIEDQPAPIESSTKEEVQGLSFSVVSVKDIPVPDERE